MQPDRRQMKRTKDADTIRRFNDLNSSPKSKQKLYQVEKTKEILRMGKLRNEIDLHTLLGRLG